MDAFTSNLLLSGMAHAEEVAPQLLDLTRQLAGAGPSTVDIKRASALKGRRCIIKGTDYTGTMLGPNMARGGFYGGEKYPVLVKIDRVCTGEESAIFEYTFDQVVL